MTQQTYTRLPESALAAAHGAGTVGPVATAACCARGRSSIALLFEVVHRSKECSKVLVGGPRTARVGLKS